MPKIQMQNILLPFRIGEQYESWEFDLVFLKRESVAGCDNYLYLKNTYFMSQKAARTELVFCFDRLVAVIMVFQFKQQYRLSTFFAEIKAQFPSLPINSSRSLSLFSLGQLQLMVEGDVLDLNHITITYGPEKIIKSIFY